MKDNDLAWVAGLLEGEGWFGTTPDKPGYARVVCQMTDFDVIDRLCLLAGGSVHHQPARRDNWKPTAHWQISGRAAIELMKQILPYMGKRRSGKILEVIDLADDVIAERERARAERDILIASAVRDYRNGIGSLRQLAKQYKISKDTIMYAARESD